MQSLESFAADFQDKTGCDDKTATTVSLLMAMLMADLVGDEKAADHFAKRVRESHQ